jgi:hypothetical protein
MLGCRLYCGLSLRETGEKVGNMDYAAVSMMLRRFEKRMQSDPLLAAKYKTMKKEMLNVETRPLRPPGSQTSCEFYVTASVSGHIIEKYSDFTIYGTCEMDCIPGGKLKCPCGCNAKFNVWIEGTRGGFGKLPTISRKRFESL